MKLFTKSNFRVVRTIAVIVIVVSFGFMAVYGFNPLVELFYLPKSLFMMRESQPRDVPEIVGISYWLNILDNKGLFIQELSGKVILIDFWTYSCINCQRSIPYVVSWDKKYRDMGLVIIGVHTPEFRFERKLENVQKAVQKYGIQYPVALDNSYKTWRAYHNAYWPAKYLIDKNGKIVYKKFGEGGYEFTEAKIKELLKEFLINEPSQL